MASETTLLGAAGEYFVMSALLRRGFIAALAPQGVPNVDIVVTDVTGHRLCTIQVKSRRSIGSDGGWHMSEKHENLMGDQLFYCFVDFGLKPEDAAQVYVLPSNVVATTLHSSHRAWLSNAGRKGQQRTDTKMRRFLPDYKSLYFPQVTPYPSGWLDQYKNAWHLLALAPSVDDTR